MKKRLWVIGLILIFIVAWVLPWQRLLPLSQRMETVQLYRGGWYVSVAYDPYGGTVHVGVRINELHQFRHVSYRVTSDTAGAPEFEGAIDPQPLQEMITLDRVLNIGPLTKTKALQMARSYQIILNRDGQPKTVDFSNDDAMYFPAPLLDNIKRVFNPDYARQGQRLPVM